MKTLRSIFLFCAILAIATSAGAQPDPCTVHPNPGAYTTTDGGMLPGRASEAFCSSPFHGGVPGNQQNAQSWDGSTLGTEWKVYGMTIDAAGAVELLNTVNALGNGMIVYGTDYDGGVFWLSGAHAWGDGSTGMYGTVDNYQVTATLSVVGGVVTSVASNVYFTGVFDDCPVCYFEFVISNALRVWVGDEGSQPADYPAFFCEGAPGGELFDVCCIDLVIDCGVGTEESSWGAIKQLHK